MTRFCVLASAQATETPNELESGRRRSVQHRSDDTRSRRRSRPTDATSCRSSARSRGQLRRRSASPRGYAHEAAAEGVGDGFGTAVDAELRQDALDVRGHRFRADVELGGDLLLLQAFREEAQHLLLTLSEQGGSARAPVCDRVRLASREEFSDAGGGPKVRAVVSR